MHVRITATTQLIIIIIINQFVTRQLLNTTQHRTVPIIFPLILQTIVIAKMMSRVRDRKNQQKIIPKGGWPKACKLLFKVEKFHAIQKQNGLQ